MDGRERCLAISSTVWNLDTIHERDGRTDGRTNGQTDTGRQQRPRLLIASRGKRYGATTQLCLTPVHIGNQSESNSSTRTQLMVSVYRAWNRLTGRPRRSHKEVLSSKLSKAASRSTQAAQSGRLYSVRDFESAETTLLCHLSFLKPVSYPRQQDVGNCWDQ